jgi:hypothetical protein
MLHLFLLVFTGWKIHILSSPPWSSCYSSFCMFMISFKSRDSSVGIALGYGLDDRGSMVWFPTGAGNFSLHHRVQNGSGAHQASYPMGTGGSFPGSKAAGAWSWPLPSIAEVKNAWSYTSTPQYVFMEWCLVKHRDNFTLFHIYHHYVIFST